MNNRSWTCGFIHNQLVRVQGGRDTEPWDIKAGSAHPFDRGERTYYELLEELVYIDRYIVTLKRLREAKLNYL